MDKKLFEHLAILREFGRIYTRKIIDGNLGNKSDLTLSQIKALYAFRDKDAFTMKDLAENVGVKLPNMTMMVDNLSQEGIVERGRDSHDRRKVIVRLTPKGKKIRADFLAQRRKIATALFVSLNGQEQTELMSSLSSVCRILEKAFVKGLK